MGLSVARPATSLIDFVEVRSPSLPFLYLVAIKCRTAAE